MRKDRRILCVAVFTTALFASFSPHTSLEAQSQTPQTPPTTNAEASENIRKLSKAGRYRDAEAAARRLRVSRSQLYATALAEFLDRHQTNAITERLNELYSRRPAKVDTALHRAQIRSLEKESW